MILKKVAFGNLEEAFVENRFSTGLNIVFSNDNNKGKTILIQSIMFSIGNTPVFPSGFPAARYYFYTQFEHQGSILEFVRHGNSFIVRESGQLTIFDSVSDFKIYFNESIYRLPKIKKDGRLVLTDLNLFFQVFYLPQDKRNTSTVINGGQFNKGDFTEMIKSMINPYYSNIDSAEIQAIRAKRKDVIKNISILSRRMSFSKQNPLVASRVLQSAGNADFERQSIELQKVNQQISEYTTKRSRESNRLFKLENLLNELNSLNRNIAIGKVTCAECGSDKIIYSNGDFTFELSNDTVRREVVSSIMKQIESRRDSILEYGNLISSLQTNLQEQLSAIPIEVTDIIISREAVLNERENDKQIVELSNQLREWDRLLDQSDVIDKNTINSVKEKYEEIIQTMREYYANVDEVENANIEGLFTKNNENFSGSEEQIFYFSKLASIAKHLPLDFPLIVDCFRDGEISTEKEDKMIEEYKKLSKQVLLTATLKDQEYTTEKYPPADRLNPIDFSVIQSNQILSPKYVAEFVELLKEFNLALNQRFQ